MGNPAGLGSTTTEHLFPRGEVDDRIAVVGFDTRGVPASLLEGSLGSVTADYRGANANVVSALLSILALGDPLAIALVGFETSAMTLQIDRQVLAVAIEGAGNVVMPLSELVLSDAPAGVAPADAYRVDALAGRATLVAAGWPGSATTSGGRFLPLLVRVGALDPGTTSVRSDTDRGSDTGQLIPTIPLAALLVADRAPRAVDLQSTTLLAGGRRIPIEHGRDLRMSFAAPLLEATGPRVDNAYRVLAGEVDISKFRNKIVFVGVTDPRVGGLVPVPSGTGRDELPEVLFFANALNTILTDSYLRPVNSRTVALTAVLLAIVLTATAVRFAMTTTLITLVVGSAVFVAAAFFAFHHGTLLSMVVGPIAMGLGATIGVGARSLDDARRRAAMTAVLTQYVPTPIARRLLLGGGGDLPEGHLTFIMTDVVGSTGAWEREPGAMRKAMVLHDDLIEAAVSQHGGAVVRPRGEGDSRFAVFVNARDALEASLAINDRVRSSAWPTLAPIQLRIGVHSGSSDLHESDYYGPDVNRCARVRGIAEPNQILTTDATVALTGSPFHSTELIDLGEHKLKDVPGATRIYEIRHLHSAPTESLERDQRSTTHPDQVH